MTVNLSPVGGVAAQFFTNTGAVLTGGKLYTYLAGTTTPATTYTTSAGTVARTNPIVLDSAGRVPSSGEIWLTVGINYKFLLKDSNDVLIGTYDDVPSQFNTDASLVTYTPAGVGAVTTTVQAKLRQYVSVNDFGAVGDGVTDDTSAIQAALNEGSTSKRLIEIPSGYSFRFTDNLTIPSDTGFCGTGELYADYTNSFGEVVVSTTGGSAGTQTLMTADTFADDTTITVASVSGISAGSYILVGSTRFNSRYPKQIFKVVSVNAITKVITLSSASGCEYLVSENGFVKPLTMISNVTVRDVTFRCSPTSNFGEFFNAAYVVNLLVENVKILNHKSQEGIGGGITNSAAGGIGAQYCFNATLQNNTLYGNDSFSPGASAVSAISTQKALIQGNKSNNYAFGVGLYQLYQGIMTNNNSVGIALSGNRGIKVSAAVNCLVDSNIASNFDSGIKVEDVSYSTFTNNVLSNMGVGGPTGIAINHATNQALTSALYNVFDGNLIYGAGIGVLTDVYTVGIVISNNVFKTLSSRAMILETASLVIGNQISGFVTYGIGFAQNSVIANNIINTQDAATPCLRPLGSFQRSNTASIVGNNASANPLATGYATEFGFCSFSANNIKDQPVTVYRTAAPTTDSWIVGDLAINSVPSIGAPKSWVCTVAGTPGTWVSTGNL